MIVQQFAERHKLRTTSPNQKSWSLKQKIQLDRDTVIEGKCGMITNLLEREAEENPNRLVLHLLAVPRNADMNKKLSSRAADAEAAGMQLKVRSGYETSWYFDSANEAQTEAAIKAVGSRRRRTRVATQEIIARLAEARLRRAALIPL